MSVAIWESELVGDGVDEQVATLAVQISDQIVKDVRVSGMGVMSEITVSGCETFSAQCLNTIGAHVHDQRVHKRNIIVRAGIGRVLQVRSQVGEEWDGRSGLYVRVEIELQFEWNIVDVRVGDLGRGWVDVGDHVHF